MAGPQAGTKKKNDQGLLVPYDHSEGGKAKYSINLPVILCQGPHRLVLDLLVVFTAFFCVLTGGHHVHHTPQGCTNRAYERQDVEHALLVAFNLTNLAGI